MKHYDYNAIKAGYYDAVFQKASGIQSKWHHLKFKVIRKEMPAAYSSHLDIGCGPGTFIGTLDPEKESYGVDIAANQIRYAQDHYGTKTHHFECIENGTLPFENETFDVVTIIEVLEHIANEERSVILLESRRVLRPGGCIIVSTPNYRSLWPFFEFLVNRFGDLSCKDQHITHYHRKRLRDEMLSVPFYDVSIKAYQFLAPFTAIIGWKFADAVWNIEPDFLVSRLGLLLVGKGIKVA